MAKIDLFGVIQTVEGFAGQPHVAPDSVSFCLAFLGIMSEMEFDEGVVPPRVELAKYYREIKFVWNHALQPDCVLWLTFQRDWEVGQYWSHPKGEATGAWVKMFLDGHGKPHVDIQSKYDLAHLVKSVNIYGQREPVAPLVYVEY